MIQRIVVGAGGLIGRALAARLAGTRGRLLTVDATPATCDSEPEPLVLDCRSPHFVQLVADFLDRTDSADGASRVELFHAAGVIAPLARIADTSVAEFRLAVEDNLTAAYAALRAVAEAARDRGVGGSLTMLGSVGATRAHRYQVGYDAAKAGVESLARGFALEYGPVGLSSHVVALGPVVESASTAADSDRLPDLVSLVPLGRYASVSEIAAAVALIGSPAFDTANGETITLDGGLSKQLRPAGVERPPAS